jgi:hypothetical protein
MPGGAETALTSVFNPGESMLGLVRAAEGQVPVYQATTGNLIRTVDAGRFIGVSKWTGGQTSVYTVVTTTAHDLITMFPGVP